MAEEKHIMIIAGEASGDLNAANLCLALKQISPHIKISGVGGELMRKAGAQTYFDIKDLSVIGLFDAIKKLPKFFALRKLVLERIKKENPDAIILVDFSGFNLRLAKIVNKTVPTIYYISPQVWASREGRIKTIKHYIHKLIVFFKFEQEFYAKFGIEADFIGHPLLDIVRPTMKKEEFLSKFNLQESKATIALLPGSRKQEIENILPLMLGASILIQKEIKDIQFIIAKAPQVDLGLYNNIINRFNIEAKIIEGKTYDCLQAADFCLVASGTATLEAALMQKPFVIIYKMSLLNYLLYLPLVKVPYIGMVNIIAKKKIVPEFIQFQAQPQRIAQEVLKFLQNPQEIERLKNELAKTKLLLGENGASMRAAGIILKFLGN
ncbi:MAG: lipid-A-disaccharide synthase [Candidatus Omnitrophica bacterium]|nr:lipid-A-disaccharide synthase [Candidatus Omnitrophota bacterium]MDD5237898.1 lipid-A-disaccharide synthase [Candidatus Omnitrophota bacterium]